MNKRTYTYDYPRPAVTADSVVFCNGSDGLSVLLIERMNEPFKGCWAFPGGFMEMEEDAEDCAKRELKEETGLEIRTMRQLGALTDVNRDPRDRTISIAFYAVIEKSDVKGSDDAAQARWFPIDSIPPLAFDHDKILRMALEEIKKGMI
jgi:8-oxo-dGTP diphosphatase